MKGQIVNIPGFTHHVWPLSHILLFQLSKNVKIFLSWRGWYKQAIRGMDFTTGHSLPIPASLRNSAVQCLAQSLQSTKLSSKAN